ncbi:MAG: YabP/YqfC family sporulation protein [Clostridia bacterium]|nr:YabP/YqfC family sporulation protein [Clostridia bacterium]
MPRRKGKNTGGGDISPGVRRSVSVVSDRSVTASGCRRIEEYSSCRIVLLLCDTALTVEGRGLTVNTFCGDEIEIRGWVSAVRFGKKDCMEEKDGDK